MKEFLDIIGLSTFLDQLKLLFATKTAVETIETDTNLYVIDVDYSQISFPTSESYEEVLKSQGDA